MTTTITSKGQVTVPKPIRDYLGLKAGSSVTFERLQNGEDEHRRDHGADTSSVNHDSGGHRCAPGCSAKRPEVGRWVPFSSYRKRQGTRQSVLPDFHIGAHAAVTGATLLRRDTSRYQSYFPKVRLIGPSAVQ
ncbi:MAG: AbrB/MazE/SpoVT family DNA-binding domain-containing protein [Steroidobacteraceae bacterium]